MSSLQRAIDELRSNDRQWEAFQVRTDVAVLAPPGSGKTKLLTTRVAYDLMDNISPPRGAACITYTRAAAGELRRRVVSVGARRTQGLFVGTVHSFALQRVLIPFAAVNDSARTLLNLSVASRDQKSEVLNAVIREVYSDPREIRNARSTIDRLRGRNANEGEWIKSGGRLSQINRELDRRLHSAGLTTFEEMISVAADVVHERKFVRDLLSARFPRIYVDEYQDLSPALHSMVESLCLTEGAESTLFAVGDPDQSIFGFVGSRPELLRNLAQSIRSVRLEQNYRSGNEIIRKAYALLSQHDRVVAGTGEAGEVGAEHRPGGFEDQMRAATNLVAELVASGLSADEISIACQGNDQCQQMADILEQRGIPARLNSREYKDSPLSDVCEAAALMISGGSGGSNSAAHSRLLTAAIDVCRGEWSLAAHESLIYVMSRLDGSTPMAELVAILEEVGPLHSTQRRSRPDDVEALNSFKDWITSSQATIQAIAEAAARENRVLVSTWASCKGLEFDMVIVLGADEGRLPFFTADRDPDVLAEARRSFYVLLTRARRRVQIYYSGFVQWPTGSISNNGPSRFLVELGIVDPW